MVKEGATEGTVKWFNFSKGFGFITPDGGSEDVFVHYSGVVGNPLKDNDKVKFDITTDDNGKKHATNCSGGSGWPLGEKRPEGASRGGGSRGGSKGKGKRRGKSGKGKRGSSPGRDD